MNMNREIKAELAILTKARNKVTRDDMQRRNALSRLQKAAARIIEKAQRQKHASVNRCIKARGKIDRRVAILEGRLS